MSIKTENIEQFQQAFEEIVAERLSIDDLSQTYFTDGSLPVAELNLYQAQQLSQQVWGQGFPPPSFTDEFAVVSQRKMGVNHRKAWLQKEGQMFEAMFWRCEQELPSTVRTVYRPVANEWRNQMELQLYVDYWEAVSA